MTKWYESENQHSADLAKTDTVYEPPVCTCDAVFKIPPGGWHYMMIIDGKGRMRSYLNGKRTDRWWQRLWWRLANLLGADLSGAKR